MKSILANQEIVKGLSRQTPSLTAAKLIELHVYNQFNHDSYRDQGNVIYLMSKQSNYNSYSYTYNPGWRDHPYFHGFIDSNRME